MEIVDDQGSLLQPSFWASHSIEPCRGQILGRLARGNVVSGGPIVVRPALLDAFHPIPDLAPFEDWWMAVRVAEIAEIDFNPEPLYVYRFHGENMNLWAEGEKRTKALADEIPFRRWMLTNLTDRIPVGDGLAALQALDEVIGTLAQARDVSPSDVVEVSAEDCATAGGARQAAAGAWRSLRYLVGYALDAAGEPTDAETRIKIPSEAVSVAVGADGVVTSTDGSGTEARIAAVSLAGFPRPAELAAAERGAFRATAGAGTPVTGTPGTNGLGTIASLRLEPAGVGLDRVLADTLGGRYGADAYGGLAQLGRRGILA